MATTVDIPAEVLAEAQRLTGVTTKKAAVDLAMSQLLQSYRQREGLAGLAGMDHNPFRKFCWLRRCGTSEPAADHGLTAAKCTIAPERSSDSMRSPAPVSQPRSCSTVPPAPNIPAHRKAAMIAS